MLSQSFIYISSPKKGPSCSDASRCSAAASDAASDSCRETRPGETLTALMHVHGQ